MIVVTDYLFFNTKQRQEFVRITDEIAEIVKTSAVMEDRESGTVRRVLIAERCVDSALESAWQWRSRRRVQRQRR